MNTQLLPPIVTVEELVGRTDIVLCDVRWYPRPHTGTK